MIDLLLLHPHTILLPVLVSTNSILKVRCHNKSKIMQVTVSATMIDPTHMIIILYDNVNCVGANIISTDGVYIGGSHYYRNMQAVH